MTLAQNQQQVVNGNCVDTLFLFEWADGWMSCWLDPLVNRINGRSMFGNHRLLSLQMDWVVVIVLVWLYIVILGADGGCD